MVKHQYYLLAPGDVVTIAILKLCLIILPFGAYVSNQSTNGGVSQIVYGKQNSNLSIYEICIFFKGKSGCVILIIKLEKENIQLIFSTTIKMYGQYANTSNLIIPGNTYKCSICAPLGFVQDSRMAIVEHLFGYLTAEPC